MLLVFGTLDIDDVHRQAGPDVADEAVRLSDHMRTDWVNFAAGNPGWPAYDPHTRSTRIYDAEPTILPYPEERSRRIWHTYHFDTLEPVDLNAVQ